MRDYIVPIVVALAAPTLAFIGIAWKLSGRIRTSEAGDLWEESRMMREEYRADIKRFRDRAIHCEEQILALKNELHVVVARNMVLTRENRDLKNERS